MSQIIAITVEHLPSAVLNSSCKWWTGRMACQAKGVLENIFHQGFIDRVDEKGERGGWNWEPETNHTVVNK